MPPYMVAALAEGVLVLVASKFLMAFVGNLKSVINFALKGFPRSTPHFVANSTKSGLAAACAFTCVLNFYRFDFTFKVQLLQFYSDLST